MSIPSISVLMPVYNTGEYLAEAIESILAQTFTDFEFIIIDDGSTDNSLSIIKKYAKIDSRIQFVSRENKGIVFTRNEGVSLSQGLYIALMDSDDYSYPNRLEIQYKFLDKNREYVVVGSKIMLIDKDSEKLCSMGSIFDHDDIDLGHINNVSAGAIIVNPTAMIRRDSLLTVGGYRERYKHAEDIDVWLRLGELGKLCNLNEVLLEYRQHFESVGYAHRLSQLQAVGLAVEDACRRRGIKQSDVQSISSVQYIKPSKAEVYTKWAWWALSGGNVTTARKYAFKAILSAPLKWHSWKLLACSIRGY